MQNELTRLDSSPSSRAESSHFPSRVMARSTPILHPEKEGGGWRRGWALGGMKRKGRVDFEAAKQRPDCGFMTILSEAPFMRANKCTNTATHAPRTHVPHIERFCSNNRDGKFASHIKNIDFD